jgi:hypothetical protein
MPTRCAGLFSDPDRHPGASRMTMAFEAHGDTSAPPCCARNEGFFPES